MELEVSKYFYGMSYNDFYMQRMSWASEQSAPIFFNIDEVEWAIQETTYKYFGSYEFTDQQKMAVDILVWVAKSKIKG